MTTNKESVVEGQRIIQRVASLSLESTRSDLSMDQLGGFIKGIHFEFNLDTIKSVHK